MARAPAVIVYRAQERVVDTREWLERLRAYPPGRDFLIAYGQLESGVVDALWPECDGVDETTRALRSGTIEAVASLNLRERVRVSVPEGYAYYALYPEAYAEAARRFFRAERPESATVIGVRSIGTSLSTVVERALAEAGCRTRSYTVRPRGHPFDRRIIAAPALEGEMRAQAESWFAVVDEGPGLSGSSFASVAAWLSGLGVPDARIVLFPSWDTDGSGFVSESARERWRRHRKYTVAFQAPADCEDLSAGGWRERVLEDAARWPAVNPQHERRKYLHADGALLKFAGLGEFGRARLAVASQLANTCFGPRVSGLYDGFLAMRFEGGRPLTAADADAAFLEHAAGYLAFRARAFPADRGASLDELREMIRVNTGAEIEPPEESAACAIDGRMLPHEWLRTPRGYVKSDSAEHHDDHFYPGPQNIAWDVAGCAVEFGLGAEAEAFFADRCAHLTGDRGLSRRLPFYKTAYRAFRGGYAALSARTLAGTEDGARFERLTRVYLSAAAPFR